MKNDDRLIYLVFMAQQKLKTYITNLLLTEGIKITLGQAGVLFLLQHRDGQTMTELSMTLEIENPTLTGLIDRLERAAFVKRQAGLEDRRSFKIYLTPGGIDECEKAKPIIKRINEEIKAGYSETEIKVFRGILQTLLQKFEKSKKGGSVSNKAKKPSSYLEKGARLKKG